MQDITLLDRSWQRAWTMLGAEGDGKAVQHELMTRYREPHRQYHTLQHLDECLALLESLPVHAEHAAEVEMALWFHDAFYDTTRDDNERRSADLAQDALNLYGVAAEVAERVAALVLSTAHAAQQEDGDVNLLADIDLAILGASPDRFSQYEQQVRQEYAFVPEARFREKRAEILARFLARPHLYATPHFRSHYEDQARRNLSAWVAASQA